VIISDKYKLVFITTPKSGSHTGFELMKKYFDCDCVFNHRLVVPPYAENYRKFTFVRNPYERFCALYHACVINDRKKFIPNQVNTINEYGKWLSMLTQEAHHRKDLVGSQDVWHKHSIIDNYMHIEDAEIELNKWYPSLKIKLPHELKRTHPTWKHVKSDELKNYVLTWAKKDFSRFLYDENYSG